MRNSVKSLETIETRVVAAGDTLGLNVSRETLDKILCYVEQLQKWNRTYNLTAIRNLDDILVNHIFDCMSVVPAITHKADNKPFTIVDVGSGAGLPGLILALWFEACEVICIDTVDKKTSFIRHVSGRMGCKNVKALHARVEELESLNARFVISRAFSSLTDFTHLAGHHCSDSGLMASMKATQVQDDIAQLDASESDWSVESLERLSVPENKAERYLVWLHRKQRT